MEVVTKRITMKTFEVRTLGCKVNQYESQALRERLLRLGLKESRGEIADVYVINTCSVTHRADKESRDAIRKLNCVNPKAQIFVTGCSAENAPEKLKSLGGVTRIVGNIQKDNLPQFIVSSSEGISGGRLGISGFAGHTRAFLKIQDGCNNGCSYCIIPTLRGSSHSRKLAEIIQEARDLAANGYKEIVLCGICVGAYGKDIALSAGLVKVIGELEKIEGLRRIRLSSIEATDVTPELIEAFAHSKKLCSHLHIPFQSGDDKILRLMNRPMSSDGYRKLILSLRGIMPQIGITTDMMVGFPGEDEKSFAATVQFLKEIHPSRMHVFSFSPRKNTLAFRLGSKGNPFIKKERARHLKSLAKDFLLDFSRAQLGRTMEVLVEASPYRDTGLYKGYSSNYVKVFIRSAEPVINKVVTLEAVKVYADGILAGMSRESAFLDTT